MPPINIQNNSDIGITCIKCGAYFGAAKQCYKELSYLFNNHPCQKPMIAMEFTPTGPNFLHDMFAPPINEDGKPKPRPPKGKGRSQNNDDGKKEV